MYKNKARKQNGTGILFKQRPKKVRDKICKFLVEKYYKLREQKVQRLKYRSVLGTC